MQNVLPFSLAEFELEVLPFMFDNNNGACFCILAIIYLRLFFFSNADFNKTMLT
jgi:hypothetical protein